LRPDRRGDRKDGSDRDAIQEMLHAFILCGSSGFDNTMKGSLNPRVALSGLAPETTRMVFRSGEHATWGVAYPTSPAADIIPGRNGFKRIGGFRCLLRT
jgi:hypothetical protein